MRYKFYREHKYVSAALNDLERLIAKTDFRDDDQFKKIVVEFNALAQMLRAHAHYENTTLHELLRKKGSKVFADVEDDHHQYEEQLTELEKQLQTLTHAEEKIEAGYQFYLAYRKFVGDNLLHLHEEETLLLPELQRLYTDEELCTVEFPTYQQMTTEELVHMCQVLFPHMNPTDREAFLTDIKKCVPDSQIESLV